MIIKNLSSEGLELIVQTNFMEALKDSKLKSFSVSKAAQAFVGQTKEDKAPVSILIFRQIEPKKLAEIDFLATHKDFKRRGLAQALIEHLVSQYEEIWLELASNNAPARSFYSKMGFELQGVRKNYYGTGVEALNMVKRSQRALATEG